MRYARPGGDSRKIGHGTVTTRRMGALGAHRAGHRQRRDRSSGCRSSSAPWSITGATAPPTAGYITSIDLAGLCVGSITTSMWASRIDWKQYVAAAIVVCLRHECAVRVVPHARHSDASCGLARVWHRVSRTRRLWLCISRVPDTARGFSIVIFAQVVANAIGARGLSSDRRSWGPGGLFVTIAVVMAVTVVVIPRLPGRDPLREPARQRRTIRTHSRR